MTQRLRNLRTILRAAVRDTGGLAMIEFAFVAPILLVIGMASLEAANYAMVLMRVNQAAVHVADNASRIGERSVLAMTRIHEEDMNDLFIGVNIQTGANLDIYGNGRIIVSSLERNADGGQWIHWQRCKGTLNQVSDYGAEDTGRTGTALDGMGPAGDELQAEAGEAVMYVEIFYEYQPLVGNGFSDAFGPDAQFIRTEAAFNVRSPRDLSQIFPRDPGVEASDCGTFDGL